MAEAYPTGHADQLVLERRRISAALACSIVLHGVLLFYARPQLKHDSGAGHRLLTIRFRAPPVIVSSDIPLPEKPLLETKPHVLTAAAPQPQKVKPPPQLPTPSAPKPTTPIAPAPGYNDLRKPDAGGVVVRLGIGEGGRVEQIIWDQLPALTDEQFKRLEAVVRDKYHPDAAVGSYVSEIVNVRSLLGLPPASRRQ